MTMSSDDLSAAYLSEHIGNEGEVPQWVTYVSSERLQYLLRMEQALPTPEESETFTQLLRNVKSEAINTAIDDDDLTKVSAIKGISDNSVDATGYGMLLDRFEPAAQTLVIKGPKGSGKSTKMSDLAWKAMDEGIVEKCMTNLALEGFKDGKFEEQGYDVRYSELISDFLEFAKESGEKVMLLDELSTVANMLGSRNDAQEIFTSIINALRKSEGGSCRIICIGHQNPTDILPTLRKNANGVIEAPNKAGNGIDRANFYQDYDEYQNGDPEFRVRGMQDISDHPLWGFDDNTFATLELNLDDPENQIRRGKLIDNWEQYQDGGGEPAKTRIFCEKEDCNASSQQYTELLEDGVDYCPYHQDDDSDRSESNSKEFVSNSEERTDTDARNEEEYKF